MRLWGKRYLGYSHHWACKSCRTSDPHHGRFCAGDWFCVPYTRPAATILQIHNLKALICALRGQTWRNRVLSGWGSAQTLHSFCEEWILRRAVTWDTSLDAVCPSEFLSWARGWLRCYRCGIRCYENQGLALSPWPLSCSTQTLKAPPACALGFFSRQKDEGSVSVTAHPESCLDAPEEDVSHVPDFPLYPAFYCFISQFVPWAWAMFISHGRKKMKQEGRPEVQLLAQVSVAFSLYMDM